MKKILILILLCGLLLVSSSLAYEINVESASDSQVILSISGLNNVDIKISDLKAIVETSTASGAYSVEKKLSVKDNKILLAIDITPVAKDFPSGIESITISGYLETDGVKEEFDKKIFYRPSGISFQAPSLESSAVIYWTVGIVVLISALGIMFALKKPKKKSRRKKRKRKI
jgi:hypothetical protein